MKNPFKNSKKLFGGIKKEKNEHKTREGEELFLDDGDEESENTGLFIDKDYDEDDEDFEYYDDRHTVDDDYFDDEYTVAPDKKEAEEKAGIRETSEKINLSPILKNKKILAGAAAAVVIIILAVVVFGNMKNTSKPEDEEEEVVIVMMDADDVTHLSFPVLSLDGSDGSLSVDDFRNILQTLYDQNYVLIDLEKLYEHDEEGSFLSKGSIMFPEGKKPLLISQTDVSYGFEVPKNTADKLVLEGSKVKAQITGADGSISCGDYDLVPVLETFIEEHPDFSYEGARGILAFTGYRGVLGYRTSAYLADPASNPYGSFDTVSEIAAAAPVMEALKTGGWHFASNGFGANVSYGSESDIFRADVMNWAEQVGSVIGGTNILFMPSDTDIASWKGYSDQNSKYAFLRDYGYNIFFIENRDTPYLIQLTSGYFRQLIYKIRNYTDIFDALQIEYVEPVEENVQIQEDTVQDTDNIEEQAA